MNIVDSRGDYSQLLESIGTALQEARDVLLRR